MKITIRPYPDNVEFIKTNKRALNLIKSFLEALGISEVDLERWYDVLSAEIDTSSTIKFEGMTCYFPDTIRNHQTWKYSALFHNSSYLLLLNESPFWAEMTDTSAVDDLPSDLLNLSCTGGISHILVQSYDILNQLRSLDLSSNYLLSDITPLEKLTQLNSLDLSRCDSLSDITPLEKLTQLNSLDLSHCDSLSDITPLEKLTQLNSLNLSSCDSLSDITPLEKLTQLSSLDLSGCGLITCFTPLKKLSQLISLNVFRLDDVALLENFVNLTSLNLFGCKSLNDSSKIDNLKNLDLLILSSCENLTNFKPLQTLTQLTSLEVSSCDSLTDISQVGKLNQLTSLKLSSCNSLTDISPLEKLTQLTSLKLSGSDCIFAQSVANAFTIELSGCNSISDITPLAKLSQLKSLELSFHKSLTNITPIANLKQIIKINIRNCTSITNLFPIQSLHQIKEIDISGCLRITKFPDFKQLKNLYELYSSLHPTVVADILAHCAVSRENWAYISQYAGSWTSELESALEDSHPAALDLATSLAIGFPHISFELSERLCQILQTDPSLDYRPWKHLFLGVFQRMGFNFLQNLASTIAAGSWPRGAIGGLSAIAEQLITLADGKELFAGWVRATSAHHESNPSFLKPVAAPWCLALHCLGENALLDQWIARFTDPDDSTALDAVFLEFGNHRLGHNDPPGAFRHAMRIRATLVRDGLLADIASHYLEAQQADQAAELLFLLSAEDKRAELSLKLADIPHFLDNRDNLHRLLAACGKNAPAIGKLLAKAGMDEAVFPSDADDERQRAAQDAAQMASIRTGLDAAHVVELSDLITQFLKNKAYTP